MRRPDYSDKFVSVIVGFEERKFVIHEATLRHQSTFFQSACSKRWKESHDRVIRLPDADADAFEVYAHGAYSGTLEMSVMPEPPTTVVGPSYLNLGKVWILASYVGNNTICNLVVDRLLQKAQLPYNGMVNSSTLQYIFENTSQDSQMQRLLVDIMKANITLQWFDLECNDYPAELIMAFARAYVTVEKPKVPGPSYADRCKYHIHEEGEETCD